MTLTNACVSKMGALQQVSYYDPCCCWGLGKQLNFNSVRPNTTSSHAINEKPDIIPYS